jgi:hypothetical protein
MAPLNIIIRETVNLHWWRLAPFSGTQTLRELLIGGIDFAVSDNTADLDKGNSVTCIKLRRLEDNFQRQYAGNLGTFSELDH